jgi:hypothetical protein
MRSDLEGDKKATPCFAGIDELIAQLRRLKPSLVVLEATGGWQLAAACRG